MALRTIMIFPRFENISVIEEIRKKYDPLAKLIEPHITLVFPFESEIKNDELSYFLETKLSNTSSFQLTLNGFSKKEDKFGNYLFLNVVDGEKEITNIHKNLYQDVLKEFDIGYEYVPHMTVGYLSSVELLEEAYSNINLINVYFSTTVDKISVEMIGEKKESIVIIEKKLK